MRELKIAYGDSRFARRWSNKKIEWDDLLARLRTPRRGTETVAEYRRMTKDARDAAKDVGGFVLGHLREGRRKKGLVDCRSGIALDADHADGGFIERVAASARYACAMYTTRSHTPEAPRLRLIIPLARDVSADEYAALARLVAEELGMDNFDDATYEPERLMYWASASADGEFIFRTVQGDWLDPDAYLARVSNWRDCSLLPTSSRQSAVIRREMDRQQDPLTKEGVVGVFCRAYSMEEAIATFLADVYAPSRTAGRYDYIPADSSAGAVLYEGRWMYSHHATDPACGRLLNAFDLVRAHKFGDMDDAEGYKAMATFAMTDERVRRLAAEERIASAGEDFGGAEANAWLGQLERDRFGAVKNTLGNVLLIFERDTGLAGIRFNRLASAIYAEGIPWERPGKPWRDADVAQLAAYVERRYGTFSARNLELALTKTADDRSYHPIREYLAALPTWDGVRRLDEVLIEFLGAEDAPYTRAVTRKTLTAAVARVFEPGRKFDYILTLCGTQGLGKSTLFARLGGAWFSDSLTVSDMRDKTAAEKLQDYWILELGELAGIRKMDVETVKSFVSRTDDKYRPSYGRTVESHPRQCVIVGTTNNDEGFLRDATGNRRFWPIKVSGNGKRKPWALEQAEVDQIWAEALLAYAAGEELFLTGETEARARAEQREAMEHDEREGAVVEYLETLLPENWEFMDLGARRAYLRSPCDPTQPRGTLRRTQVSNTEIWCECLGLDISFLRPADSYALGALMARLPDWERSDKRGRLPMYGLQRLYRKVKG